MAQNDMMEPGFKRLLKADGHLGALFDVENNVMRFVCRQGTVDYDLNAIIAKETRREHRLVTERVG